MARALQQLLADQQLSGIQQQRIELGHMKPDLAPQSPAMSSILSYSLIPSFSPVSLVLPLSSDQTRQCPRPS